MNEYAPTDPSPPGDTIKDMMEERGLDRITLARRLGIGGAMMERLLSGTTPITGTLAYLLSEHLGGTEDIWLSRERNYREAAAPPIPAGFYCVRCEGSGFYCPDCGARTCVCPEGMRPSTVRCEHDRAALRPLHQVPGDTPCDHLPALSEPSMRLHCTRCGSWLKSMTIYVPCGRDEADRGTCGHSDEAYAEGYCLNCNTELES